MTHTDDDRLKAMETLGLGGRPRPRRRGRVGRAVHVAHLQAMQVLDLVDEGEARLLVAWRAGDAAVISEFLTECLRAGAKGGTDVGEAKASSG